MRRLALVALIPILLALQTQPVPGFQFDHGGIVRGDVTEKQISLVFTGGDFDDGVPAILRIGKERGVPVSFFVTGDFLRLHPDSAKAVLASGNLLGPHSDKHLLYCDWANREKSLVTREQFLTDLKKNLDDLKALGAPPSPFFVPPYEWFNAEQVEWSAELGLRLINFTPGSGSNRDYIPESDPKFTPSKDISAGILKYESTAEYGLNGFILLLHAGSMRQDKMHDYLDELVVALQHRGYEFVTLEKLLGK